MRRLFFLVPLAAFLACEQRFSSSPPPVAAGTSGPAASVNVDALLASTVSDAGTPVVDTSRAIVVTLCSAAPGVCAASPETGDSPESSYYVVFGSGRGVVRSRGQAMADLYKELRDRLAGGERLDAEPRPTSDAGASPTFRGEAKKPGDEADPLSACAFHLLDVVDGVGSVTLDVVHGSGAPNCSVTMGGVVAGGASRCLVKAPERVRPFGR
jgi:hypothetical protein